VVTATEQLSELNDVEDDIFVSKTYLVPCSEKIETKGVNVKKKYVKEPPIKEKYIEKDLR
jgi:hypothetical protein